ncbi:MAG: ABC transporter permease [Bdellovibrionota bacterium]|nr:MAG: ABC transporter permease [Bdellovibrionota bacterium]
MFDKLPQPMAAAVQPLLLLTLLVVVFALSAPAFLSFANLNNVLTASATVGLIALGATFVIASGNIDLSPGAVMALSAVVTANYAQHIDASPVGCVVVAGGIGLAVGLLNGWLISLTGAPSFIITLGTLSVARAIAYIASGGVPVYGLPDSALIVGQGALFGIHLPVLILMVCVVMSGFTLRFTRFGQHTLHMGDDAKAAQALGINLPRLRLQIFGLAGALAGLAGLIFMARTNSGDPSAGQSYELLGITAVILGGANLFGGKASVLSTFTGLLALAVLQNGLNLLAIETFYQVLFVGLVLILSAGLRRGELGSWR